MHARRRATTGRGTALERFIFAETLDSTPAALHNPSGTEKRHGPVHRITSRIANTHSQSIANVYTRPTGDEW